MKIVLLIVLFQILLGCVTHKQYRIKKQCLCSGAEIKVLVARIDSLYLLRQNSRKWVFISANYWIRDSNRIYY
jgi:hypothetical protein